MNTSMSFIKNGLKQVFKTLGYEIRKSMSSPVGSDKRPVGRMDTLLEDLKFRGLNCQSVLDVGANNAQWSRMAKEIFPSALFYLIEPQVEMQNYLNVFCEENQGSKYFLSGAGMSKGVLTLTVWDDLAGSSFLPMSEDKLLKAGKQREIEIITIDDLLSNSDITPPDLIKIDVQGFELEVLKGASKTFGNTEVYILEVSLFSFDDVPGMPVFSDIVNFMLERNYTIYDFAGFLRRPYDGALGQSDLCFVKKDGFLRKSDSWK